MLKTEEELTALRPRLHRYAARMMGSSFDGEDVVQDALAKLAGQNVSAIVDLERWMFRVTHTCALDALRRRRRQAARDARAVTTIDGDAADSRVAVTASLATFLQLQPRARAVVALVDVLGHSLAETANVLGMTNAAVKAALHRGRLRLCQLAHSDAGPRLSERDKRQLSLYAERFNAHDWDGLRAMLAEDVKLDLVSRRKLSGAADVSTYFSRYAERADWHVVPGVAEGRAALLFWRPGHRAGPPSNVVLIEWAGSRLASIRDYLFVSYFTDGLEWSV